MKRILTLTAACCLLSAISFGQPPRGNAKTGDTYGGKVSPEGAEDPGVMVKRLGPSDTLSVKVKGKVLEVCRQKGCWMTLRIDDSTEAFVKMKDYAFFVPTALAGKTAVIEGIAFIKTTSVAELKHYAEDAGKPKSEIDAITRPESQVRLLASGIVVAD